MGVLSRIGVALDSDLLAKFDRFISEQGYTNRSEAFRDLIRDRLVGATIENPRARVVGTVTITYDHHSRLLPEKLMNIQHDHYNLIISTTHVHLDHHACLEVLLLKGEAREVQKLADVLIGTKGVQHGRLVMSISNDVVSRTA